MSNGDKDESEIQRFEDLATRLFLIAKEDVKKAEQLVMDTAEDIAGADPEPATDTD